MKRYIALLRGINVGGKNLIAMPQLKALWEKAGFEDVRTYINSGNVIFSAVETDALALQQKCRQAIAEEFRLDIAVAVISAEDWLEALAHAPAWWGDGGESKHNAIVVIPPAPTASVLADIGAAKPEYEQVACYGQVIFWSAWLKTFSHCRWAKVASSAVYNKITIRNANTAKRLGQLAAE